MRAITADWLLTPLEQIPKPVVLIDEGVIAAMGPSSAVAIPPAVPVTSFAGAVLSPVWWTSTFMVPPVTTLWKPPRMR